MGSISPILTNFAGLFGRGFILAGALPVLIGCISVFSVLAIAIGFEGLTAILLLRPTSSLTVLLIATSAGFILVAVVAHGMRDIILKFFSGDAKALYWIGLAALFSARQRRRYQRRLTQALPGPWHDAPAALMERLNRAPHASAQALPGNDQIVSALKSDVARLTGRVAAGRRIKWTDYDKLAARLVLLYGRYTDEDLSVIDEELAKIAETMELRDVSPVSAARAELRDEFGPRGLVKPTRLGNTLLALDYYPFARYGLDGGLFWSHLEGLADEHVRGEIAEKRVQLDMVLAHAAVFLFVGLSTLFAGPWLGLRWVAWCGLGIFFLLLSRAFYSAGVRTASSLARSSRAVCDLLHHELLKKLGCKIPMNLVEEREIWDQLNRLVAFGEGAIPYALPVAP
jgi:hypothetical protein